MLPSAGAIVEWRVFSSGNSATPFSPITTILDVEAPSFSLGDPCQHTFTSNSPTGFVLCFSRNYKREVAAYILQAIERVGAHKLESWLGGG